MRSIYDKNIENYEMLSRKKILAIIFSVVLFVAPMYLSYVSIPEWIDRYNSGAPIGVEIDIFTESPIGDLTVTKETETGSEILAQGKVIQKQKYTFTPETLPEGVEFHLALTEKHYDGVDFRKFVDSIFGTSFGKTVEVFEKMQFFTPIIGSILSLAQSILTVTRNEKKPGFWFYDYTYIVIIGFRKKIILENLN